MSRLSYQLCLVRGGGLRGRRPSRRGFNRRQTATIQPDSVSHSLDEPKDGTGEAQRRLGALTGLRFVAALGVVLNHYRVAFRWWDTALGVPAAATQPTTGWTRLLAGGALGVDCFFVLSGFILAYTYATPLGSLRGTRRAFWVARLARIYPVYLVGLALDALPFVRRSHHLGGLLAAVVSQPLLLQAWVPSLGTWNTWNPPGWSLSVEAFFYLLFPFILTGLTSLACRSRWALWAVSGLSWGLFAALPALLLPLVGAWHRPGLVWTLNQVLYYNPLVRLPEFTLGMALGLLSVSAREQRRRHPFSTTKGSAWDLALAALALAVGGLLLLPLPGQYPARTLVMPIFAAAIVLLAQGRGAIARLLSWRGCVWLGDVSYAVYILHVPLWAWLAWIAQAALHISPAAPVLLPIYLAGVLVAAGLSFRFVERPARTAIRARWAAWEARHEPTAGRAGHAEAAAPNAASVVR